MIRVADARDIESIADVHVRSWQAIYRGHMPDSYLDPSNWRQGIGRALMGWSVESARTRQWPKMTLWVLDKNAQARSVYKALGWRVNGRIRTEAFGGIDLREVRYVWFSVA